MHRWFVTRTIETILRRTNTTSPTRQAHQARKIDTMSSSMRAPPVMIGPSLLACDLSNMAAESRKVLDAGAEYLHLDVMDGHFVPNISFGPPVIQCLRKNISSAIFDVHLMVSHPEKWIDDMAAAGVNNFTFHIEAEGDKLAIIEKVKAKGMKVGLAIKPRTPVEEVLPFLDVLDIVLVMTVEPGFGGQKFMSDMMPKVRFLRERRPDLHIEVDGGLGPDTIDAASEAGANMIVAGSSIFKSDPREVIETLKK
jgi:ribulose-phosphate 3-epimerase